MLARILACLASLAIAAPATAAEITIAVEPWGLVAIRITGPLVAEDSAKFKLLADKMSGATVILESVGGSAGAAIGIGTEISRRKFATLVYADKQCVSACGFIWLAGNPRIMDEDAKLGFHGVYVLENGKPVTSGAANAVMGAYLGSLELPPASIYFVTEAKPDGMNWLTLDKAKKLGIPVFRLDKPWERKWAKPTKSTRPKTTKSDLLLEELFRRSAADEGAD